MRPRIAAGTTSAVIVVSAGKPATRSMAPISAATRRIGSGTSMNTIIMNRAPTDWLTPAITMGAPETRPAEAVGRDAAEHRAEHRAHEEQAATTPDA